MASVSVAIKLFWGQIWGQQWCDDNSRCRYIRFPSDKVIAKHMKQVETSKYSRGKGFSRNLPRKATCNLMQSVPDYPAWRRRDKDGRAYQECI